MRTIAISLSLPALVCLACAADEPVSDDVSKGWRATQLAYGSDQAEWEQGVDIDGSLDLDLECPDGGSYRAVGTYTNNQDFDLTIEFAQCAADGVVIDGHLALQGLVAVTENSSRVEVEYDGELTWSGDAEGSCAIDMTTKVAVSVDDDSADVDVEAHGSICGYDADAVVHASAG